MQIFVNGRFRSHKVTGVQRYAHELTTRLGFPVFEPASPIKGWRGHFWEQSILPLRSRCGLLFSPCAAGPLIASRQVITFHDLFAIDNPEWYGAAYAAWYSTLLPVLAARASHLIAVSEYTKQRLVQRLHVPQKKITVIHNGISRHFFRQSLIPSFTPCPQLQIASYLLCVGSLEPRKNLGRLLTAWSLISSELPSDCWLVIVGSGDPEVYRTAFSGPIPARVHLTGYVNDDQLVLLYSHSLGFVYPSLGEGFGLPPLEGMACGSPVLTSSIASLPEICGAAALYADPVDVHDLASKLKILATDASLRSRLSQLGLDRAKQFTWDRTAENTLNLLQSVANPN